MLNPDHRIPMTPAERREQRLITKKISDLLRAHDIDPLIAVIALQNVQAAIIATRILTPEGRRSMIEALVATLPLYVGVYEKRERELP